MNSFISTSLNRDLALFYLGSGLSHDDDDETSTTKRLLFEINADPSIEYAQPFADISKSSDYPEEEVLFMLGSIFRLDSIVFEPKGKIWIIGMTLCSDNEHQAKDVYERMRNELCARKETPNLIHLGNVLYDMGQFAMAEKYFRRLLNNLPDQHPDKANCIHKLGLAVNAQGDHHQGLELLQEALEIRLQTLSSGDELIGNSYNSIGLLYEMTSDFDQALTYLNKAEDIFSKLALPATHPFRQRTNQATQRIGYATMSTEPSQ